MMQAAYPQKIGYADKTCFRRLSDKCSSLFRFTMSTETIVVSLYLQCNVLFMLYM